MADRLRARGKPTKLDYASRPPGFVCRREFASVAGVGDGLLEVVAGQLCLPS